MHTVGAPQRRQGQLQSDEHRLDPVDTGNRFTGLQHCPQREPGLLDEGGVQFVDRGGESRLIGEQLPTHTGPLRTLTGVHEHGAGPTWAVVRTYDAGCGLTDRQRRQPRQRLGAIPRAHRGEQPMPAAVVVERVGHLFQVRLGAGFGEPVRQHPRCRCDPRRTLAGDHQGAYRRGLHRLRGRDRGCLLQHDVCVSAAEAEGGHTRPARPTPISPISLFSNDFEPQILERDVRIGVGVAQRRRNHASRQRQRRLGQTGHPRRGLQMTQVRLHRPDQQWLIHRPAPTQHRPQCARLDRIPQQRPGAMRLDIIDLTHIHTGIGIRRPQHRHLRSRVRRHQPVGPTVLIDRRPPNHRQHPITVATSVRKPLQHHHPGALTAHESVRRRVEGVAGARSGHGIDDVETAGRRRGQQHVHPTGQRHLGLPRPQTLTRQMHRHQRRRTRGVHRHRRTPQIKHIRQPIGDDAQCTAGPRPGVHRAQIRCRQIAVLGQAGSGEDTGLGVPQRLRRDTGMFKGFVGDLQQQPLLGVHLVGLTGRDFEELRIEGGHVIEESAPPRGAGQRRGVLRRPV